MDVALLGVISWWKTALAVLFTVVCIVLIIVVLLQKGRGGGLSAAFGGAGGHSAFGSKTGDVFTWATIVIVGLFLLLAMILTYYYVPDEIPILPPTMQQPATGTGEAPPGQVPPAQVPPAEASDTPVGNTGPGGPGVAGGPGGADGQEK